MTNSKKVGILDLLILILRHKRFFIISMLVISVCAVILSMMATKYYTATAVILPPKQDMSSGLGSLLSDLPVSGLLKSFDLLGRSNTDQFMSILSSRRIAESAIDRFDLIRYYGFKKQKKYYIENVIKAFNKSFKLSQDDHDNISIAVTDTSPRLAYEIANFLVSELDKINFELSKERAKNSRLFFEDRLKVIQTDLDSATKKFTEFQIANSYIDLDAQVRASIDALARIEGEKLGLDLQIAEL
jgi:tyrosine-protein kinase Etk/Wzc